MKETLELINKDTWIISDLHLGHNNIMVFEPKRKEAMKLAGFEYHEDWLVHNWNSVVKPEDTVLCLGDFAFQGVKQYTEMLNGNKILIIGNHDKTPKGQKYKDWTVVDGIYVRGPELSSKLLGYDYDEMLSAIVLDIDDTRYMFSHYAVWDDNKFDRENKRIAPRMDELDNLFEVLNCDYSVHGHTHSKLSSFPNSINVSLEHLDFKPQKLSTIINSKPLINT